MNWLKPPTDGSGVHGARRGVLRFSPRRFTQHSFLTIVISHRYRNMKSDAPTGVNLRDVVATGQATPSQSILTPSTIGRDDILSQVTREQSSLTLSDSSSLDSSKSKGHTRGPLFAPQSTTSSGYEPRESQGKEALGVPTKVTMKMYMKFKSRQIKTSSTESDTTCKMIYERMKNELYELAYTGHDPIISEWRKLVTAISPGSVPQQIVELKDKDPYLISVDVNIVSATFRDAIIKEL